MIIARIVKHEWRILSADKTVWAIIIIFALTIGYAIWNGAERVREHRETLVQFIRLDEQRLDRLKQRALEMERALAEAGGVESLSKHERYEHEYGPTDSFFASHWGQLNALAPPAPLGALSVGQSDLYPLAYAIAGRNTEPLPATEQTESALKLLLGHFDLAFVLLYLYPIMILALSFNLLSSEKESGVLGLLLSQPRRLRTLLAGKIIARATLIFGAVALLSAIGMLLGRVASAEDGIAIRLALWLVAAAAYGAFWFSLAILINALGKSASANALTLVVLWILMVIVIPSTLNLLASTLYPVPSRASFVDAKRRAVEEAQSKSDSEVREKFFANHPEFSRHDSYTGLGQVFVTLIARDEEKTRLIQKVEREFDRPLARQRKLARSLSFLSPPIFIQDVLHELSGAGGERHQYYRSQVSQYHREWIGFFWPKFFASSAFTAGDYDRIPRFKFHEESTTQVASRVRLGLAGLLAMTLLVASIAAYRLRRYPIVG